MGTMELTEIQLTIWTAVTIVWFIISQTRILRGYKSQIDLSMKKIDDHIKEDFANKIEIENLKQKIAGNDIVLAKIQTDIQRIRNTIEAM